MRRAAAVVTALWMASVAGAAQQPAFRSSVDAVRVDVGVTDHGRSIGNLSAVDFDLTDSGIRQQIEALAVEDVPLNLVFAFDVSFSIRGAPLDYLKEAARSAVASLRPIDRVALLTFSHTLRLAAAFADDRAAVNRAIDQLVANGATALTDAVSAALALRPAVDGRTLLLVFTDGLDTGSWLGPLAVIEQARRSDAVVDAVLLDDHSSALESSGGRTVLPAQRRRWFLEEPRWFGAEFLPAIADETGGEILIANRGRDLHDAFRRIIAAFRARYVLTYSPRDVAPSGWHPIEVRLKNGKGTVRARRGYAR
jgi:VWFA-related protein